jgi:GSH-dependent disulfide-bond oxidoreductase
MYKFYYNLSPSPMKVALLLEELNVVYEPIPVNTSINIEVELNNVHPVVPTLQDGVISVFNSGAILLYLADKENKFLPSTDNPRLRAMAVSWLNFLSSELENACKQTRHFRYIAPKPNEYALNLFDGEAHRHWTTIEQHLAKNTHFLGDEYSVVDMAFWSWARLLPNILGSGEAAWEQYPNVKRLTDLINNRPAIQNIEKLKAKHNFKVARRYRPAIVS